MPARCLNGVRENPGDRLRGELQRTLQKIAQLEAQNAAYRADIRALSRDDRAVEDLARAELGFVRPGELVIVLGSDDDSPASASAGWPAFPSEQP